MGKIVISTNVTLDGVVQDPDGQEGFERGGWFHQFVGSSDLDEWIVNETEEALGAEALLLGRTTFEWFASRAPSMGERVSRQWADRMNGLPKYVVSSKRDLPQWSDTVVLDPDATQEIQALKRRGSGDILVYGSYQLVRSLMARNLVDELRGVVFPVILGTGLRLFDGATDSKPLHLVGTRKIGHALVHHTYDLGTASGAK
jgi:dihydrofolate reductase